MIMNKKQKLLREAGLCITCGKNPLVNKNNCDFCRDKARIAVNVSTAKRNAKYKSEGLCRNCGREPDDGKAFCSICINNQKIASNKKREQRRLNNLCLRCGQNIPLNNSVDCETCVFKNAARTNLKDNNRHQELKELFVKQKTCPYTGLDLILRENASVDHKMPISKGGSNETDNLQWVHIWANTAKSDCSESEFLEFIRMVAKFRLGMVDASTEKAAAEQLNKDDE